MKHRSNVRPTLRTQLAAVAMALAGTAWAQGAPAIVGEATMVIGQATLIGSDGAQRSVARGASIRAGDRIETQAGGHVHVRFVDGGRLSVRPASRLVVEDYAHSERQPQLSAIRFRLEEGVVRSITGTWGESSRDRFRLNTPLAAIGIKGTDFVVRADASSTAASVYSGAILLSPMTEGCGATLGPCLNGNEKLLSEDMKGWMLELAGGQPGPRLVAAADIATTARRGSPAPVTVAAAPSPTPGDSGAPGHGPGDRALLTEALGADVVQIAAAVKPPEPRLVWGRYAWVKDPEDTLSTRFSEATAQGREMMVAGLTHALFREAAAPGGTLTTTEPNVAFRLNGSESVFLRRHDLQAEAATVAGGSLTVDFAQRSFSTQIGVSSPSMGAQNIQASGAVTANGLFQAQSANARFLGGTSLDGREAGYLFEKSLPAGDLRGITLWGR